MRGHRLQQVLAGLKPSRPRSACRLRHPGARHRLLHRRASSPAPRARRQAQGRGAPGDVHVCGGDAQRAQRARHGEVVAGGRAAQQRLHGRPQAGRHAADDAKVDVADAPVAQHQQVACRAERVRGEVQRGRPAAQGIAEYVMQMLG